MQFDNKLSESVDIVVYNDDGTPHVAGRWSKTIDGRDSKVYTPGAPYSPTNKYYVTGWNILITKGEVGGVGPHSLVTINQSNNKITLTLS